MASAVMIRVNSGRWAPRTESDGDQRLERSSGERNADPQPPAS
jgi:hypothetical protein